PIEPRVRTDQSPLEPFPVQIIMSPTCRRFNLSSDRTIEPDDRESGLGLARFTCTHSVAGRSGERGVNDDIARDQKRAFVGVTLAVEAAVTLERAADVVFRVNDRPVVVELDSLELGVIATTAGCLGVLDIAQVGTDLGGE